MRLDWTLWRKSLAFLAHAEPEPYGKLFNHQPHFEPELSIFRFFMVFAFLEQLIVITVTLHKYNFVSLLQSRLI